MSLPRNGRNGLNNLLKVADRIGLALCGAALATYVIFEPGKEYVTSRFLHPNSISMDTHTDTRSSLLVPLVLRNPLQKEKQRKASEALKERAERRA